METGRPAVQEFFKFLFFFSCDCLILFKLVKTKMLILVRFESESPAPPHFLRPVKPKYKLEILFLFDLDLALKKCNVGISS